MSETEELLSEAVSILKDDTTYPFTVRRAMIGVLATGLAWLDDAHYYGDLSDRRYKILPNGRATIALAEAIIQESA